MEQNLYGQMETENNVKKETTTSIEHSDFEDIFTGYGNTDSVQKIVSDYNSDEDVESETDYHNIAMKTTCFDIHEQQLEIIRQYASGMIFSQNLLSDVPERHVVSGFLSVHNFICDSIKNTELNDKAEIFKHGIPQFREVRSKQLFHESEDNKYTSDCCHGQHKIVETDKRQHARTYVVKDCCRRAPRNTRQENNISPNCPYMNGQKIGNVPIHEEDRLQPRHHIEQTLVPSTAPVNQARVAAEAEAVRIPGDFRLYRVYQALCIFNTMNDGKLRLIAFDHLSINFSDHTTVIKMCDDNRQYFICRNTFTINGYGIN
jgi:hypothetical protein